MICKGMKEPNGSSKNDFDEMCNSFNALLERIKPSGIIGVNDFRQALEKILNAFVRQCVKSKTFKLLSWVSRTD